MTNSTQRKIGVILQYLQMGLSIIIQLIYVPIMLKILGDNQIGIYNIASSTISYLSLLSLGFGSSYLRFYTKFKQNNDENEIENLNGLYLIVFFAFGIIALIFGVILASNINLFFNETYTVEEKQIAKILMIILTINLAISFPASVFTSYITSQEKFIFLKLINMGKTIASPILCIVFLFLGYGSIGMVLVTTCVSIIVDTINVLYCFISLKMKISFRNPQFCLLKDIFVFSIFIAINQIIDLINWQTDKIILGKMINGGAVAIYTIGAQINTMFTQFSVAVSGVFAPKVNRIIMKNDDNMDVQLTELFINVGRVQWFILMLIMLGFIFFGKYFIYMWAGEGYENAYYIAILLMIPAIVPLIQNVGIEIQRAKNRHQFRSIVYLIMAIVNVGVSIWFVSLWKEIGAAIGTTISLIIANGIIMNIYYHVSLKINIISFWKSIISTFPSLIIPSIFGFCLLLFYEYKSICDFLLLIIAFTLVYCISVYFFGINNKEKKVLNGLFRKIIKIK